MNCCVSDNKLRLVKGDTLSLNISLTDVDIELIDKVYFTCTQQNIRKELILQDGQFMLNIDPSQTALFKEVTSDYDITIVFKNGETSTVVYRSGFTVLPKTNKLIDYEDSYIVTEVKELPEANASNENRILIYNNTPYISVNKDGIYQWEELAGKSYVDNTYVDFNFTANDETNTINLTMTTPSGKTKQMSVLRDNVDFSNYYTKSEINDLLPKKVSELENDKGFINESIFDISQYLIIGENKISIDGYNALRNFVLNKKGGIAVVSLDGQNYIHCICFEISNNYISFNYYNNQAFSVNNVNFSTIRVYNDGAIVIDSTLLNEVLANENAGQGGNETLSTIRIGGIGYKLPTEESIISLIDSKINTALNDVLSEEY